jgi:hypothetical protein
MVATAERSVTLEGLVVAVSVTVPLPVPFDALLDSHAWSVLTVHVAFDADAVTSIERLPPLLGTFHVVGVTVNDATLAACVTVTDCPAIMAVAVRALELPDVAAVSVTDPLPLPPALPTVSQAAFVEAVHVASE